jgi:hypothetical protein
MTVNILGQRGQTVVATLLIDADKGKLRLRCHAMNGVVALFQNYSVHSLGIIRSDTLIAPHCFLMSYTAV